VPEVVGTRNIKDFEKWERFLSGLGYSNFAEILNAKNYGVPQNRERCFMVSILGNHTYYFPKIIELKHKLKDLLEHQVNQKYYLSNETIKNISEWKAHQCPLKDIDKMKNISPWLTARGAGEEHSGMILINEKVMTYNYSKSDNFMNGKSRIKLQEASDIIKTKVDYGIIVPGIAKKGYAVAKDNEPKVLGGIGQKDSNNNTQWKQQNRIYDNNVAISVATSFNPFYKNDLQIRKLTPKECFRLMGVKDEDYDKIATNQSDTGLYHLAGDSIVVNVLMAIFGQFKMEEN
jgi:DNA (cytosine-5)-methyltransferase 1